MRRMGYTMTDEELLENYKLHCASQKEFNIFERDYNQSKIAMKELVEQMTPEMLQGVAKDEHEKHVIRRYNRMCRHLNGMQDTLLRAIWRM